MSKKNKISSQERLNKINTKNRYISDFMRWLGASVLVDYVAEERTQVQRGFVIIEYKRSA